MSDETTERPQGFETRQVHAGQVSDPTTGACATPIYQTTAFSFRDAAHGAALFSLAEMGNIYTRIMNPTQGVFEARVAALEGGVTTAVGLPGALAVASGMAAETCAIMTLAEAGSHIVTGSSLYGGTYNLFRHTLPKMGIEVTFVEDAADLEAWKAAVKPNTKAFYAETIGNPRNDILDISAVADVAHAAGVPLIVDNTVASPFLCRPLEHGADIVVHSATKFIGGHGTSIGGVIVDGGSFDFGDAERFPGFNDPDESYGGLTFWPSLGHGSFILKARLQWLRDTGAAISPFNAFLLLQGLETLSLRMERHVENAKAVVEFLDGHDQVESVNYAGLASSPWAAQAAKYVPAGAGSVPSFVIKGGRDAGERFANALELHEQLANLGDARSLVVHPGSTTHSQLNDEEQRSAGVEPGLVRLSVGIETIGDIIAYLEVGFAAAKA